MSPARTPTAEQAAIIAAFSTGKNLAIEAGAGSGKTTTLKMLAAANPAQRGVYVAYNKAIASDAQREFPDSVKCATAHSFAYGAVGRLYRHRLNGPRVPAREAARMLRVNDPVKIGERILAPAQIARLAMETVDRFCRSADCEPGPFHVPRKPGMDSDEDMRDLRPVLVPLAVRAWDDLSSQDGQLQFSHDCQPPGTLVRVVRKVGNNNRHVGESWSTAWDEVPIEQIREGDKVVSWGGSRLGYIRKGGRRVTKVGARQFDGELIAAKTPTGQQSAYTPEHICIAMIADALDGKHVVYMMRRGGDYRIGRTPWRLSSQGNTFGPVHRAITQGADALWVLSAHDSAREAALAEALAQQQFNIPGWQFRSKNQLVPLGEFWSVAGGNARKAETCLSAHGRDLRFPLWENDGRHYQRRPIEIRACNLMDGMRVCVVDQVTPDGRGALIPGGWTRAWQPVTLTRAPYSGPVHFLDVETDHTYVADGIVTHNCYLKLWQLSGPQLSADYVLLDEAQDANPVILSVVQGQRDTQLVAVGDRSQAIYGWRGAIDAMDRFSGAERLALSQSFRFGPAIADEANKWLAVLKASLRLTGFNRISSVVSTLPAPDAVLCRTNGETISRAMSAVGAGRRAAVVGGGGDIRRLAEAAITLKAGRGTTHSELMAFQSWAEVQDHAENDPSGADLKVLVDLIDRHGPDAIIAVADSLVDERRADTVISTAHKAKGREWDTVKIASDFREPKKQDDGSLGVIRREEAMLAYVAVTRARLTLDRAGLAWVDKYLAAGVPA